MGLCSKAACRSLLLTHSVLLVQLDVGTGAHCMLVTTDTTWETQHACEAGPPWPLCLLASIFMGGGRGKGEGSEGVRAALRAGFPGCGESVCDAQLALSLGSPSPSPGPDGLFEALPIATQ